MTAFAALGSTPAACATCATSDAFVNVSFTGAPAAGFFAALATLLTAFFAGAVAALGEAFTAGFAATFASVETVFVAGLAAVLVAAFVTVLVAVFAMVWIGSLSD